MVYNSKTTSEEVAQDFAHLIHKKVILTTGVTAGGIGAAFVLALAQHAPRLLILAGRNTTACEETARAVETQVPGTKTRILKLDLGSFDQVRQSAAEVLSYSDHIDVLVNNAGVMATPFGLTTDGIESQFAINHLGHFLFTNLIMEKLLAAPVGARVVCVSSSGYRHGPVRFQDWNFDGGKTYDMWRAYGQSKTANMLFAVSLASKLGSRGITALSLNPGLIFTPLMRHLDEEGIPSLRQRDRDLGYAEYWGEFEHLVKNVSQGAATHVFAAFDPSTRDSNGGFLHDCQVQTAEQVRAWARDPVEAEMLWKLSEEIVGQQFQY